MRGRCLALLLLCPAPLFADCARDMGGEVYCGAGRCARDQDGVIWCSRFDDGGVETTFNGEVLCGRGECAKTSRGGIFCSTVNGGAVLRDSRGRVRCEGRCEPGQKAHCESTRADGAG